MTHSSWGQSRYSNCCLRCAFDNFRGRWQEMRSTANAPTMLEDSDSTCSDVGSVTGLVVECEPAMSTDGWDSPSAEWTRRRKPPTRSGKIKKASLKARAPPSPQPLRLRTYTARRNEIERLMGELPQLEAYADLLKQQAVRQSGKPTSIDKQLLVNSKMRELAYQQQLAVARALSAMSSLSLKQPLMLPLDRAICLPKDPASRVKTLLSMRARVLRDARIFMENRTLFLDPDTLPCHEQSAHVTSEGDTCSTEFAALRLDTSMSVKAVFDALCAVLAEQDVVISEVNGDCTVTEAVDVIPELLSRGISHHRRVSSVPGGLLVESNGVIFSEYREADVVDEEKATIVVHAVEKDELRPYATDEQLRLDVSAAISVRAVRGALDRQPRVVLARSIFLKLHRASLVVTPEEMRAVRDRLMQHRRVLLDALAALVTAA